MWKVSVHINDARNVRCKKSQARQVGYKVGSEKWGKDKSGAKIKVGREKWVTKWGVKSEPRNVG